MLIFSAGFGCESGFRRQRRSIDLQKELAQKGAALFESPCFYTSVPFQKYFKLVRKMTLRIFSKPTIKVTPFILVRSHLTNT